MNPSDEAGGTRLRWRMRFEAALESEVRNFILKANEQNSDRLEACLATDSQDRLTTP